MLVIVQSYGEHDWWVEDRRSVANLGQRDARALGQGCDFFLHSRERFGARFDELTQRGEALVERVEGDREITSNRNENRLLVLCPGHMRKLHFTRLPRTLTSRSSQVHYQNEES